MWTLIFGSSTWTAVLIVHLADVEPPEKSQRPVLDWPGDLHWFGQTKGFDGESSESNSPWKRFAPNSICLPALHSTANLLMWDFVKTSPSFLAQQKTQEIPLRLCQSIARRARVDAKACFLTWHVKSWAVAFLCKAEPTVQPAQLFCSRRDFMNLWVMESWD